MNRHQKKALSLAAAIANLSFSVIVTGVATYAWYAGNVTSHVNVNEASIAINSESSIKLNYDIYKYSDDEKAGKKKTHDDFFLPEYDDYITDRNIYSNVIVRAEVNFSFTLDTSKQALVINIEKLLNDFKITKTDTHGTTYENVINNKTSNVIQFKSAIYSYTTTSNPSTPTTVTPAIKEVNGDYDSSGANDYKTNDDAVYTSASTYFRTSGTSNSFVTVSNNEAIRVYDSKLVVIPNLSGTGTLSKAVVYIECSYRDDLVDKYIASQPATLLDTSYKLDGDISSISFDLADAYTITYHSNNGGDTTTTESAVAGTYVLKPANTFSFTGHTFNKWALGSISGTQYSAGATYTVSSSVHFYATWTTNNYTVTYNANGGTVSPASETVAYDGPPTFPTPTRSNYTFDGWKAPGSETLYTSSNANSYTVTGNVTFTAQWTSAVTNYTITYNANGGSESAPSSPTTTTGSSFTLPSNTYTAPTISGADSVSFNGWLVNDTKYAAGATVTGISANVTVKAIWKVTVSLTKDTFGLSGTTYTTTSATIDGTTYNVTDANVNSGLNFKRSTGCLYNSTSMPGPMLSVTFNGIKFSQSDSAGFYLYGGASSKADTTTFLNNSGSTTATTVDMTSQPSYRYFYMKNKGTRTVAFSSVVVVYEKR